MIVSIPIFQQQIFTLSVWSQKNLMPYSGGISLKRNIVQCLDFYNIPLKLSHTVVDIKRKRPGRGSDAIAPWMDDSS